MAERFSIAMQNLVVRILCCISASAPFFEWQVVKKITPLASLLQSHTFWSYIVHRKCNCAGNEENYGKLEGSASGTRGGMSPLRTDLMVTVQRSSSLFEVIQLRLSTIVGEGKKRKKKKRKKKTHKQMQTSNLTLLFDAAISAAR